MDGRLEVKQKVNQRIEKKLTTLPDYVREWSENLYAQRRSPKTISDYINKVRTFLLFFNDDVFAVELTAITQRDLNRYFTHIQTKTDSDGEVSETSRSFCKATWFALNSFFEYMVEIGKIEKNYLYKVKQTGSDDDDNFTTTKENLLSAEDFSKMLLNENLPGYDHQEKIRNKAILLVLMRTGMRRAAVCEINVEDIDFEHHQLRATDKRDKHFVYELDDKAILALERWVRIRPNYLKGKSSDALFVSKRGNRLNGNVIRDVVNESTQKALGRTINPHKIRGGVCTQLYDQTHDIEYVRRFIGHKQSNTTKRYINIDDTDVRRMGVEILSSLC